MDNEGCYSLDRATDNVVIFLKHISKFLLVVIGKIGVRHHNQGDTQAKACQNSPASYISVSFLGSKIIPGETML
jgi:hypothetical protein